MFDSVFTRLVKGSVWRSPVIADLPQVPPSDDALNPTTQQFLFVAGGLALVLSRCPEPDQGRHLPYSKQLYLLLRKELRRHGRTSATAALLLEAFHEVSAALDPVSREAFKRCLDARRSYDASRAAPLAFSSDSTGPFASQALPTEVGSSQRAPLTISAPRD